MVDLFGSRNARDAPGKKVTHRDFKGRAASGAVLKECLTHPATIYPLFGGGGLGLMWLLLIGPSPPVVLLLLGSVFVGASTLIWNYVVKGPEKGVAYVRNLIAQQRQQQLDELEQLAQQAQEEGFIDGAGAARDLSQAYRRLRDYLSTLSQGTSVDRYSILAADGVADAGQLLRNAFAVFKASQSHDAQDLQREIDTWNSQLELCPDKESSAAKRLSRQIKGAKEQSQLLEQNQDSLSKLLDSVDEIRVALEFTYLQKVDLATMDPGLFLAENGGSASRLRSAVKADRSVRERLGESGTQSKIRKYLSEATTDDVESQDGDTIKDGSQAVKQ